MRSMRTPAAAVLVAVIATALTTASLVIDSSTSARAETKLVAHVYNTGGDGLWLHTDSPTVHGPVRYVMPDGTNFDISCWEPGDDVNGDAIWDVGIDDSTGDAGLAADYYLSTPVTRGNEGAQLSAMGVPQCGNGTPSASDGGTTAPSGSEWVPYCGPSKYVDVITVSRYQGGAFTIDLEPSLAARTALDPAAATNEEWHAVQDCVSGLYGSLADSIYEQINCHQHLALVPNQYGRFATGDTYGLDSWHPTFPDDLSHWISTECGNSLGTRPSGNPIYTGRPDDGVTDVSVPADLS